MLFNLNLTFEKSFYCNPKKKHNKKFCNILTPFRYESSIRLARLNIFLLSAATIARWKHCTNSVYSSPFSHSLTKYFPFECCRCRRHEPVTRAMLSKLQFRNWWSSLKRKKLVLKQNHLLSTASPYQFLQNDCF